ncbi:MAG: protein kinase family protein [Deltaproteobacteria bacterium]|nr:protein kinase family protein [Deltaproteobacteria bacterium]
MTPPSERLGRRLDAHAGLSQQLASCTDDELWRWLEAVTPTGGFGRTRLMSLDGAPVFAKSLPLTHRERDTPGTANTFALPTYYSYGVGSAGFGAWRELASHQKTTDWVLSGAIETFPLMLHHRVLPRTSGPEAVSLDELEGYVSYWNGSPQIRDYIEARHRAEHEIVVFLEYVPHVLREWLPAHPDQLGMVMDGMQRTLRFLSEQGVIHFDAHLGNVLTDGQQVYLTDFGLQLDEEFALSDAERSFFEAHRNYDLGLFVAAVARALDASSLQSWAPVADWMKDFLGRLKAGSKSDGGYDDQALGRLLAEGQLS